MYELTEKDKSSGGDKKLEKSADWNGPIKERSCTDVLFILGLIVAWIFMTYIGIVASKDGHVDDIVYGYDAGSKMPCTGALPYWYPVNAYTTSDGSIGVIGACVESCPTTTSGNYNDLICVNIPGIQKSPSTYQTLINEGYCLPRLQSTPVFNNRCFFTEAAFNSLNLHGYSSLTGNLGADSGYMSSFFNDIMQARNWVFGFGFCVALALSFVWCYVLRLNYVVDLFIWCCFLCISGFGVILGAMMMDTATKWEKEVPQRPSYQYGGAKAIAAICLVLSFLWLCLLCAVRKQIALAIGLLKCTAKAITDMPTVIAYPLIQVVGFLLFLIPWMFYCVLTASMGNYSAISTSTMTLVNTGTSSTVASGLYTFDYGSQSQWYPWILLGIFYWTFNFIGAIGQITLGIIFSTWYFTRDRSTLGSGEVCSAIKASFKHAGTAAFGALIIAIIQMIRATIAYFQRQAKNSGTVGKAFQYILCVLQCCVCCLECCMKFINKNAYIQTAIFGTSFCTSAKAAFFLIARNIIRIGAVSLVSELVIIVGKLFIALISAGLSYYCMAYTSVADTITSPIGPAILVFIIGWCTADMFTDIFSMAISVLLQCFVADEEMFEDKSERFAPPELSEYIDANPMQFEEETKKELESNQANAL